MDLNARVDVNCGQKDRQTDGLTENWTPISHLAKAGATKMIQCNVFIENMNNLSQHELETRKQEHCNLSGGG